MIFYAHVLPGAARELLSSPNGTCTCSTNSHVIYSTKERDVLFFYLNRQIIDSYYGGAAECISGISSIPGVLSCGFISEMDAVAKEDCFKWKMDGAAVFSDTIIRVRGARCV